MFSLIITIISIALVAALALATLYYGGDAFNQGKAEAEAAQVLIQGQQVLAAADLYYLKNSKWPDTLQQLVDEQFLQSVPTAQAPAGALAEAQAAARVWTVATAGVPVYVLPDVDTELCKMVNKKTYGMDGVLKQAYTSLAAQCYGTTENAYTVVVSKGGDKLPDGLPVPDVSGTPGLPAPTDTAAWDQVPGTQVGGGSTPPGGGGTGGTGSEGTSAMAWTASLIYNPGGAEFSTPSSGGDQYILMREIQGEAAYNVSLTFSNTTGEDIASFTWPYMGTDVPDGSGGYTTTSPVSAELSGCESGVAAGGSCTMIVYVSYGMQGTGPLPTVDDTINFTYTTTGGATSDVQSIRIRVEPASVQCGDGTGGSCNITGG